MNRVLYTFCLGVLKRLLLYVHVRPSRARLELQGDGRTRSVAFV